MYGHQTLTASVQPLFDNVSEGDIKGYAFQHNKSLLVQLSIFLIDLFVGTYRLSSHGSLCNLY